MKIGKAPTLLKKAVSMCKSKTGVLMTKLLLLASLRRRMAMATVISYKIQVLIVPTDQARGDNRHKAKNMTAIHDAHIIDLSHQLDLFDQEENGASGCSDWTLHDYCCNTEEYEEDVQEPSVIDVIRSKQELEGLEFNMDDEIDEAAEMFITRFREQMSF
jgi:sulfur transfer complex TusBCD TusB component (DsrH family)